MIVIVVVVALFGSSEESPEVVTPSLSETVEASANESKTKDTYSVGKEVKLEDASVMGNSVEKSAGIDWDKPKSGNKYVIVSVTIKSMKIRMVHIIHMIFQFKTHKDKLQTQILQRLIQIFH